MSSITTFSGKMFDPINPNESNLDILDIAHSLSMICRCNGHTKMFYSVAQHSIACALEAMNRGYSKEVIIGCLLHDASECYLSDVTRPIKKELTYYLEVESNLQNRIYNNFIGRFLNDEELKLVYMIDDLMLSIEFLNLMPITLNDEYKKLTRKVDFSKLDPEVVKKQFIDLYHKYY